MGGADGEVSLNYVDADIRQIIRLVLGDVLKQNYSIEPGVMGLVSIHTSQPLRRDALLSTLEGLLEQVGATITFNNGIFRIGLAGDEAKVPALVADANLGAGSQVVTLRYASAQQLVTMLRPYVGDAARMNADPNRNVLILSGTASARQNIIDLVRVFDVDYLAGQSYALFAAKSGDPQKLITDLTAALQLTGDSPLAGAIRLVAIEEASAVMVITQQPRVFESGRRSHRRARSGQARHGPADPRILSEEHGRGERPAGPSTRRQPAGRRSDWRDRTRRAPADRHTRAGHDPAVLLWFRRYGGPRRELRSDGAWRHERRAATATDTAGGV